MYRKIKATKTLLVFTLSSVVVLGLTAFFHFQQAFAAPTPVQAGKADDVVESFGAATHFAWGDSVYTTKFAGIRDAMQELGIRYYRSDASNLNSQYQKIQSLNGIGMKGVFEVQEYVAGYHSQLKAGTAAGILNELVAQGTAGIYAVEGPNEYDHSHRATWASELRAYQTEIYNHVKANPAKFGNILVSGPSLVTGASSPASSNALGNISNLVDIGTHHHYECCGRPIDDSTAADHALLSNGNYGGKPILYTETGVCTNRGAGGNSTAMCVSKRAQAKYILRSFLDKYRINPRNKSFVYEFIDQGTTNGNAAWEWGIVENNLTRKPAFYALKNLIAILEDKGNTNFTPGRLSYEVTGGNANLRQVLVQKKDGRYYLMLWQVTSSFNATAGKDIEPAPLNVTVTLANAADVKLYEPTPLGQYSDPNAGATPRRSFGSTRTVNVQVPDSVIVLEIGGTPGEPGSTGCDNMYASGSVAPAGYGAAWNVFSTARELLVKVASCAGTTATVTVGNGSAAMYVYKSGYRWTGGQWQSISFSGPGALISGVWYTGSATGSFTYGSTPSYFVGYTCQQVNSVWKCGCKDTACTNASWQLQGIQ